MINYNNIVGSGEMWVFLLYISTNSLTSLMKYLLRFIENAKFCCSNSAIPGRNQSRMRFSFLTTNAQLSAIWMCYLISRPVVLLCAFFVQSPLGEG